MVKTAHFFTLILFPLLSQILHSSFSGKHAGSFAKVYLSLFAIRASGMKTKVLTFGLAIYQKARKASRSRKNTWRWPQAPAPGL